MSLRPRPLTASCVASVALAAATLSTPLAGAEPTFEEPGALDVTRYLAPEELSGPGWKVAPTASSDGAFNTYTVESRFGSFRARGRTQLGFRGKEVEALAELERVSKTEVFAEAVVRSAVAPVKVVASFAEKPGETVEGISGGAKRLWSKTRFQVKEVSHDAQETVAEARSGGGEGGGSGGEGTGEKAQQAATSYAKKYLGLSGAERRWYAELGVDPYTDNEALKKAIQEVSRVEAAANFGMRFAGLPTIPGAREIGKVMDLVWKTDPWELRLRNRKLLLDAGVPEATARAFEDNEATSPSLQTALLQSFAELAGVAGREQLVARAIDVATVEEGRVLVSSSALLVRYHRQVQPLAAILPGARIPVARAADGGLVAVVAVDALFWTREIAEGVGEFAASYAAEPAKQREVRVVGQASPRFVAEAKALGWTVRDRWQLGAPEDRQAAARPSS